MLALGTVVVRFSFTFVVLALRVLALPLALRESVHELARHP